ncbi:non-ribosomal peptide synthetase [Streptomyces hilarionis]|uniref:non-ribosomal peptide synthetase n=1 Tax=Streptomyces hilarionis TaxID=2839954 RepID=UPI00211A8E4D|nr:non-ribosomal peptide synthetase [Streptomyces hilarionis]MCQ9131984.1 non-ribosomal peptide synthetase [Streptomyces hilarionis]
MEKNYPSLSTEESTEKLEAALRAGSPPTQDPPLVLTTLFARTVRLHGGAVALADGAERVTYDRLNRRANRMARHLQARGVGRGDRVGVHMHRSPDLYAVLLAVLKAGGCVVPLDPAHPTQYLARILREARPSPVICDDPDDLPPEARAGALSRDDLVRGSEGLPDGDTDPGTGPEDTAFLMYTSGSTGRPKGVRIAHRGLARLGPHSGPLDIGPPDGLTQSAAFSFAASTIEIWLAFLHGATLLPMPPGLPSLPVLREAVEERGATVLSLPCGLFNALVDQEPECLRPVRIVLLSGDFPSPGHLRRALAHTDAVVYNGYGCTENSSITALHPLTSPDDVDGAGVVPIGRPLPTVTLEVYDPSMRPCDADEVGELCVGGTGVALGYADQPELTAEKFTRNPDGDGLLYRTGDLARRNDNGDIVLVGRSDGMVKIRGFRVETSAVTLAVRALDGVADAAVKAFEDEDTHEKRLVAFYTTGDGCPADPSDLVRRLSADLPSHMVPSVFRHLEKMPTNVNGKIDRTALTVESRKNQKIRNNRNEKSEKGEKTMQNPLEAVVLQSWIEISGMDDFSTTDSFLGHGGNSLHFVQLASRLQKIFGIEITTETVFRHGTVEQLARFIEESRDQAATTSSSHG